MPASSLRFSRSGASDQRVLRLLESLLAAGGYVTGEVLAERLGVSRTAVWKIVHELVEQGYDVEARARQGYRIHNVPDLLVPLEVVRHGCPPPLTREILWFRQVESTNVALRRPAQDGLPDGTLAIAEEQLAGRGRLGRSWTAPPCSSLLFSLLLRPAIAMADSFALTMLTALAVMEGIEQTTGLRATIKWPNDVLIEGRKTTGILCELDGEMERLRYAIVGIGINVNFDPADYQPAIPATATSLQVELGRPTDRLTLLRSVLLSFDRYYERIGSSGIANIHAAWRACLVTLGQSVQVATPLGEERGVAEDVDDTGALLLRHADGSLSRIAAGDVVLPAAPPRNG